MWDLLATSSTGEKFEHALGTKLSTQESETGFAVDEWVLILGGSSGFGLATAKRFVRGGIGVLVVHRDRRAAMKEIQPRFDELAAIAHEQGCGFHTWNADATTADKRDETLGEIAKAIGSEGRIRVLLHSIAFGNLKLIAPEKVPERTAGAKLAQRLGIDVARRALCGELVRPAHHTTDRGLKEAAAAGVGLVPLLRLDLHPHEGHDA